MTLTTKNHSVHMPTGTTSPMVDEQNTAAHSMHYLRHGRHSARPFSGANSPKLQGVQICAPRRTPFGKARNKKCQSCGTQKTIPRTTDLEICCLLAKIASSTLFTSGLQRSTSKLARVTLGADLLACFRRKRARLTRIAN